MPISGPSSYEPTANEFIAHRANADAELGVGNEIVLPDGSTAADMVNKKDELVTKRTQLTDKINDKEGARGEVEIQKAALLVRIVQFNEKVRAYFPGTKWLRMLSDAPNQTDGQSRFMAAAEDANSVWQKLNADPGTASPLTLVGGYDQATFAAAVAALRTEYTAMTTADNDAKFIREQRNDLQDELYAMLKSYRAVLPTFFPKDHALVQSLPRLTPLPGSTPDAVVATGEWDETQSLAKITWTASTDPNLAHYDVRFVAGPEYSSEDETITGTFLPGETLEHLTFDGLSGPGTTASYKVYVVLTTGNEKGSNAVSVTHP